jgi:hypothetical protein
VHRRLVANLARLARQIEEAHEAGVEVRPGWLFAQERYRHLLADLEQRTIDFAGRAAHPTRDGQVAVVALAREDLPPGRRRRGPAPASARRRLLETFARVPHNALRELVGYAGDGHPSAGYWASWRR